MSVFPTIFTTFLPIFPILAKIPVFNDITILLAVSGVTGFGVFVELNCGVEGLVKIETLKAKRKFIHDDKNYTLSDGKTTYKLGQKVKIKVAGVNITERKAEFIMVNQENRCKTK